MFGRGRIVGGMVAGIFGLGTTSAVACVCCLPGGVVGAVAGDGCRASTLSGPTACSYVATSMRGDVIASGDWHVRIFRGIDVIDYGPTDQGDTYLDDVIVLGDRVEASVGPADGTVSVGS